MVWQCIDTRGDRPGKQARPSWGSIPTPPAPQMGGKEGGFGENKCWSTLCSSNSRLMCREPEVVFRVGLTRWFRLVALVKREMVAVAASNSLSQDGRVR